MTRLYTPLGVPAIDRGGVLYRSAEDGSIYVPDAEVEEFIAMGCTREPRPATP